MPRPAGGRSKRSTGIDKQPCDGIDVFTPGPSYGDGPGVVDDFVGDTEHHGGAQKAVYAFAREELDRWETELGRELRDGWFGENLTTEGIALDDLRINQRLRIGETVVAEVSVPRSPCSTFARHMGEPGWVKRFAAHGRCGVYLRVVTPGRIRPGDTITLEGTPEHEVTMVDAFVAAMGDDEAARRVVEASCLPAMYHDRLVARLAGRERG